MALCCAVLLAPAAVQGQGKPQWVNPMAREMSYPAEEYLVGFSSDNQLENETLETTKKRVAKAAQAQVAESIRLKVSSKTSLYTRSDMLNQSERFSSVFTAEAQTESNAEIAGLRTEPPYYDAADGTVHAFAYIKRSDLIAYYQSQVALHLNAMDGALQAAAALAESGAKAKAFEQCEKAVKLNVKVVYAQDLLTAVDRITSESGLQLQRTTMLERQLNDLLNKLENSVYVHVACAADAAFAEQVSSLLTEANCSCSFTDSEQSADVVITLAPTHRCTEAESGNVFCHATATVSVFDRQSNKTLKPKVGEFKRGWTKQNYDKATEEAYKLLAQDVANKVMPYLKK
jgi:hypothetical protein